MITIPGIIVLRHPDEAVLIADYRTISDLEDGYDDRLYELETDTLPLYSAGERWVGLSGGLRLPDGLHCRAGADLIWRALDLGPGDDLLDCPCQDGRTAMYLARKGACLVGVDPDPVNILRARRRFAANDLPGEFLDLDPEKIHFSRRFDAIVNRGNHSGSFRPRERRALLEKFSRALKPGRRLFIEVLLQGETEKNRYHRRKSPLRSRDAMAGYRVLPQSHGNPAALNMPRKTLQEWRITLRASGLRDVTILGGGDASGLIPECRLIIIAHKP
jgi:SAM-dependent methyltransferase